MRRQQAQRTHHVMTRIREWRGSQDLRDLVVHLRENVEQRQQGLVVVERKRLKTRVERLVTRQRNKARSHVQREAS